MFSYYINVLLLMINSPFLSQIDFLSIYVIQVNPSIIVQF